MNSLYPSKMLQITRKTLQFLKDIKENNRKPWFLQNKLRYQEARKELSDFGEEWLLALMTFDESLRDTQKPYLFRIYRDARFAKGRPYKNNLGLLLVRGGRPALHQRAGYYLHLEPGKSFLVGGAYLPPPAWLGAIRNSIAKNPQTFKKILSDASFKKFFTLEGDKVKTAPRGFAKDHPQIELLKHKDFMAMHYLSDSQVLSKDFFGHAVEACRALKPFNDYLNQCAQKK